MLELAGGQASVDVVVKGLPFESVLVGGADVGDQPSQHGFGIFVVPLLQTLQSHQVLSFIKLFPLFLIFLDNSKQRFDFIDGALKFLLLVQSHVHVGKMYERDDFYFL